MSWRADARRRPLRPAPAIAPPMANRLAAERNLDGDVEMLRSNFIGGIKRMPVRWDAPLGASA